MPLYLGNEKIKNLSVGAKNIGVSEAGLNSETTTDFEGLLKGENGKVAQAVPGVDYATIGDVDSLQEILANDIDSVGQYAQNLNSIAVKTNASNTLAKGARIAMDSSYIPSGDNDVVDKKYVDNKVSSSSSYPLTNGPILFESSGTFNPSDYGLKIGSKINVICIGGGAGGSGVSTTTSGQPAGVSSNGGDYGCGGCGSDASDRSYGGGGGGSGYLTQKTITLVSLDTIPITIGTGGTSGQPGKTSSFGSYLEANGGSTGTFKSEAMGSVGYGGAGGHPGEDGSMGKSGKGGAGWTVQDYYINNTSGTLSKGSGAVFIWY